MTQSKIVPENVYLIISEHVYPIDKEVVKIGRLLDNDVVVQNNLVSRNHAEIRYENEKFVLYDMGSSSGTFLNNKKIEKNVIYSGDMILCANTPMIFIVESSSLESSADDRTEDISRI